MNKTVIAVAAVAAALLAGCKEHQTAGKAPRPVRTATAHLQETGETIAQTGEVRPRRETPMSFRLSGQLTYRAAVGTTVKAGEVIATLGRTPSENGVLSAQADLATAKADLELSQFNADRNRNLFDKSIASKAQMQQAEATLATAGAKFAAAQAALANAEDTLSYTEIKATHDGVVSAVGANEGQVVGAGQTIATVISNTERDAVFDAPEILVGMDLGDPPVEITLLSDPKVKSSGRIREIAPSSDPMTRTYRIKVALDAFGQRMPFGSAVTGSLMLNARKLIQLPASALTENSGKTAVFVLDPAAKAVRYRDVKIDRYTDTTILVAEGLAEGDLVATSGVSKLRDGEPVLLEQGSAE
ncbi:MAG TPA: efflux RND transporter periplasmic adaptor subunit [Ensifer sp.]|nr:efflux RND transporter periplasmic adaptor subunit [Ensifer sp.]